MTKSHKILCATGSTLLLVMAAFHGSGYSFISDAMAESNASVFLKDVVPAVFMHVSMHLVALSAFGFLTLFLSHGARALLVLLALAVMADAILAFYMGGAIPAALLTAATLCFALPAAWQPKATGNDVGTLPNMHSK